MRIVKHQPSITEGLTKDSPLYIACHQPQLMYVKKQNYGVRKLWKRLSDKR